MIAADTPSFAAVVPPPRRLRLLPQPVALEGLDVRAEREFWNCYEQMFQPLPGGGLQVCWKHCVSLYQRSLHAPDESGELAVAALQEGKGHPALQHHEWLHLHMLVSRRLQALRRRNRETSPQQHVSVR